MSWSRAFDEPIALPNGRVLKTLSGVVSEISVYTLFLTTYPRFCTG
jgi:hypothetical protein